MLFVDVVQRGILIDRVPMSIAFISKKLKLITINSVHHGSSVYNRLSQINKTNRKHIMSYSSLHNTLRSCLPNASVGFAKALNPKWEGITVEITGTIFVIQEDDDGFGVMIAAGEVVDGSFQDREFPNIEDHFFEDYVQAMGFIFERYLNLPL